MQKTVNSVSNICRNGSKLSTGIFDNFYSVYHLLNSFRKIHINLDFKYQKCRKSLIVCRIYTQENGSK